MNNQNNTLEIGSTYKGGEVINKGIQGERIGRLFVRKELVGREYVVVRFPDYSTKQYFVG